MKYSKKNCLSRKAKCFWGDKSANELILVKEETRRTKSILYIELKFLIKLVKSAMTFQLRVLIRQALSTRFNYITVLLQFVKFQFVRVN